MICLSLAVAAGCSGKNSLYSDDISTLQNLIRLTDTFTKTLDKISDKDVIVQTVSDYTQKLLEIKPGVLKLEEKYPDIKLIDGEKGAPEEVQPWIKKYYESLSRMRVVVDGKLAKYGRYPDVMSVFTTLKEVLYYY